MADGFLTRPFSLQGKTIWVAGHNGLVGAALTRRLEAAGHHVLKAPRTALDLRNQAATQDWLYEHKPDAVILAAAKVGGILANDTHPADFLYDNLMIEAHVIHGAYRAGVKKLLFLGSSCIYPREAPQPVKEEALLTGPLEPTNEAYAIAKIAGIKLCRSYRRQYGCDFISAMPCNLYGPGDRFDPENSHVIPALMMKFDRAVAQNEKEVEIWGSGLPLREFMHVDDCAAALVFLLENYSDERPVNIGTGQEVSIKDLAKMLADVTGYRGALAFNLEKPDGAPRKVMDSRLIRKAGWTPHYDLKAGLVQTYDWYRRAGINRPAAA